MRILEDRFVFVEYQLEEIGVEVSPYTIMVDDKPLTMKRVVVEDFKINYICLFDYLFISSQMSAKPYFIGSTGILLLW